MIRKLLAGLITGFSMVCAMAAVNINTATEAQLATLKGIGPAKAKAIVEHRTKNGPFKTVDALKDVKGVGDATFNGIKADVTLTGATTAPAGKPADPKAGKPMDAKPADPKAAPAKPEPMKDGKKPEKAASKPGPKADKPVKKEPPKDAPKDGKKKPDEKKQ